MSGRSDRVIESHRLARRAFVVSMAFILVGVGWAVVVVIRGGSWWGPLHAFLAGAVLAAISGATQMFTITWVAAKPPPRRLTIAQGVVLMTGVLLVLIGVPGGRRPVVWLGGSLVAAALVLLAVILVKVIRSGLLRRFDMPMRFYLLALGAGLVGVSIGTMLGSGVVGGERYADLRIVHLHLNVVGLVGFTILGTLPTLLPTFAHHRIVSGRELVAGWWLSVVAAVAMFTGIVGPPWLIGVGVLSAGAAGVVITVGIVVRLGGRGLAERLPFFQVVAGVAWLIAWTIVDAVGLIGGAPLGSFSRWTTIVAVVGIGQVLVGAMAYLVPVVLGAPIGPNLRRMGHWPWLPLVVANLTGFLLVADWPQAASVTGLVWVADLIRRAVTLRRPSRPQEA